jgi:hypothetical protein
MDVFPSSNVWRETPVRSLGKSFSPVIEVSFSKGPNRVGVWRLKEIQFPKRRSSYLEFQMMEKVQRLRDSVFH